MTNGSDRPRMVVVDFTKNDGVRQAENTDSGTLRLIPAAELSRRGIMPDTIGRRQNIGVDSGHQWMTAR